MKGIIEVVSEYGDLVAGILFGGLIVGTAWLQSAKNDDRPPPVVIVNVESVSTPKGE